MAVSKLGEPQIDVLFDDVIENGNSSFLGCELLAKDRDTNCGMPCPYFGKYIIEVAALV